MSQASNRRRDRGRHRYGRRTPNHRCSRGVLTGSDSTRNQPGASELNEFLKLHEIFRPAFRMFWVDCHQAAIREIQAKVPAIFLSQQSAQSGQNPKVRPALWATALWLWV